MVQHNGTYSRDYFTLKSESVGKPVVEGVGFEIVLQKLDHFIDWIEVLHQIGRVVA